MAEKGVAFNTPPEHLIHDLNASIGAALAELPPDAHGAVIAVATMEGTNAVVVGKLRNDWVTKVWIGKKWGGPIEGGAALMRVW